MVWIHSELQLGGERKAEKSIVLRKLDPGVEWHTLGLFCQEAAVGSLKSPKIRFQIPLLQLCGNI